MEAKQKSSKLTIFAVFTTITLLVWAAYGAYGILVKVDLSTVPEKVLTPVNPNLDTAALDLLEKKKLATEEQIASFVPAKVGSGQSSATSSASPSAQQP